VGGRSKLRPPSASSGVTEKSSLIFVRHSKPSGHQMSAGSMIADCSYVMANVALGSN
jgi:hypothetical protein